ncbi:MAG: electron transfer flavoprotein subunit alpha/FixB family protein [Flavobacteriales bacterium]|nr:electron transfer flavoprotein subunit alpha/FixB family protein [Flavobacteriales bacterium]
MSVLVFVDNNNGKVAKSAFEAVSYGKKVAAEWGTETIVLSYGQIDESELTSLSQYGASKAIVAKSIAALDVNQIGAFVKDVASNNGAKLVVFSLDYSGKTVAGAVAAKLNAGIVSGAVDYPDLSGGFKVKKAVFSGKAFATYSINSDVKVVSIMPNSVGAVAQDGGALSVEEYSGDLPSSGITVKEFKKKGGEGISITEAEIVVSAGRGLKGPENWGMVEELATEMGAGTACSRPVADAGWRPHHEHVGQTGVAIRPNLYIAIGISGAIQHLAGVNGSKVMVVINTDPEAPFFKAADYGIVGDAFEVVPKLIQAYKSFREAGN